MDVERALIWKAVQGGALEDVIARGIEADHFADPDCREVYEFGIDFMRRHKSSPSTKVLKEEFPSFKAEISKDPLSYHLERFIHVVKERKAVELVRDYIDMIEDSDEVPEIELRALEMARELTEVVPAPRATRYSEGLQRIEEYERRKEKGEIHGTLMGIPAIDEVTLGIQPHELVTIAAYMGVGKSTLMQHIAYSAYLQGKTVLFISLEMEAEALWRKIDTMATRVKYHAMKAMELGQGDVETWRKMMEQAHKDRHDRDIIIRDDIKNCTVDHIMAETMRYKPDIVVVDYLELMRTPRGVSSQHWEKVAFSGEGLKQNARVMRIPHVTAAQLTREGGKGDVTLATIGYQSVGKHSDLVVGLSQDEEKEARQEMDVLLLKNRDGKKVRTTMRWILERMDIGEKGIEERFPARSKSKSMVGHERRKHKKLEVARTTGGRTNPFSDKVKHGARTRSGGKKKVKKKRASARS